MESLPPWLETIWRVVLYLMPWTVFFLFFLHAVNWRRFWPVLRGGGAVSFALLLILVALVWSQIAPAEATFGPGITIGNFWWQLLTVLVVAGVALLAGWIQDRYGWYPPEYTLEPAVVHGHAHDGHDHGSDHHHTSHSSSAGNSSPGSHGH